MILKDWWADYPDAENFLYPLLHTANRGIGGNVSFYSNPEFDRVVDQSRVELDSARRVALYRRADSIAFADAPMVFLFFYNELYAVQPWVQRLRGSGHLQRAAVGSGGAQVSTRATRCA